MSRIRILSVLILMLINGCVYATSEMTDDSLNNIRLSPDYVKVSLVVVSPGKYIYSGGGHTALRLTCPSEGMDYYFSFEMAMTPMEKLRFLSGTARAGFIYTDYQVAADLYWKEGREIRSVDLNLTPLQKQELWRYLDDQYEKGPNRYFDYIKNNCNEMILTAVEVALGSETIEWKYKSPDLSHTYRTLIAGQFTHSPWNALLLNLLTGEIGDKISLGTNWLWPNLLIDEARLAVIKDSIGERPLVLGDEMILLKQTRDNKPFPITPKMVFLLLLVLAVVITIYQTFRKNHAIGYVIDIPLAALHLVLGLIYTYTTLTNLSIGFNWIILLFNPIPFCLWLLLRSKRVMKKIYVFFTILIFVYLAFTPCLPQLQTTPIAILILAFAVRTAYHAFIENNRFYLK